MKKILQVNSVLNYGSTGRIADAIGDEIIASGWESYIAYGRTARGSDSNVIKIGDKIDNYAHVIYTRLTDRHCFSSTRATKNFIKEIDKIDPDIIHLHNIHGYYLNIELFFSYLSGKNTPVVWTLHDCWTFTGHCTHYSYEGCYKWKTECNKCPLTNLYPASFIDNSTKNFRDKRRLFNSIKNITFVSVSNWLDHEVKQSFLKGHSFKVIKNGIDLARFKFNSDSSLRDKYSLGGCIILLGVASVWDDRKGLAEFINFSHSIEKGEKLVLIGISKKQKEKLPDNIIGIERTESIDELASFYSEADVFLNLTLEDNYPTTNLEAIACGTPVITYNTGGSVEAVDADTGFVVEQGDFISLRQKINVIKVKGKSHYKIKCRDRAVKEFDKNKKFIEYIDLYDSLIN